MYPVSVSEDTIHVYYVICAFEHHVICPLAHHVTCALKHNVICLEVCKHDIEGLSWRGMHTDTLKSTRDIHEESSRHVYIQSSSDTYVLSSATFDLDQLSDCMYDIRTY